MALSRFPKAFDDAADAVLQLADAARYVRDTSGDLRFEAIDRIQMNLRKANVAAGAAMVEAAKAPADAETFMQSMGGPQTLAAFQATAVDLEAKAAAWNATLSAWLNGLSASNFAQLGIRDQNGVQTKHIMAVNMCDEAAAAPLRTSQELADLITVLESVGA